MILYCDIVLVVNKKGIKPFCSFTNNITWRVLCVFMLWIEKYGGCGMGKKNLLFVSLVLACVIVGYLISIRSNPVTKDTATTEKSVEAESSAQGVSNESHTVNPDEVPFKTKSNTIKFRINPILGEKKQ